MNANEKRTLYLSAGEVLTIAASSGLTGVASRLARSPGGGDSQSNTAIDANGAVFGPYAEPERFRLECYTGTLTFSMARVVPVRSDLVVINEKTPVNAVAAAQTLTSDNTEVSDGDTVTIGDVVYRFKDTPAQAYDVQRHGTTADTTMGNLIKAINATGTEGVEYYAGTLIHPDVSAGTLASHAFDVTAKVAGTVGNSIAVSKSADHLSWGDTELAGGVDGTLGRAWEVCADSSYLYLCLADNTTAGANWRRVDIGSAY